MERFESLLREHENVVSRFVKFKINDIHDAEDIIQETYLSASRKFDTLQNEAAFKAWIISIARNKCNDYFRAKADSLAIPIDSLDESVLTKGRYGIRPHSVVRDTLELLGDKDKQILYLYFFKEYSQEEIAGRLNIPVGTVKSRLYNAKKHFKEKYPYHTAKGDFSMKGNVNMKNRADMKGAADNKLPLYLPDYTIKKSDKEPFSVKWEELMGWFLIPKLGEKLSWAMYDFPEKKRTEATRMEVIGKAEVHGIEGVEIATYEYEPMECNRTDNDKLAERTFVAQLTDTHCRCLAESHMENGVKKCYTFLDGESFLDNWGFERYKKTWSEMLPESERLVINGVEFVHWYDCVTDYIL